MKINISLILSRAGERDTRILATQRSTRWPNHVLRSGFSRSYFRLTKNTVLCMVSEVESEYSAGVLIHTPLVRAQAQTVRQNRGGN